MASSTAGDGSGYQLLVNGQRYGGWTSIEVTKSLDTMTGAFEVESTDRWPGQPSIWPIQTGDAVKVLIDGELLFTGWVDEVSPEEDSANHSVKIHGRGRTCDLVDCSAMNTPGRWRNLKLEAIVADLCKPFNIAVTASADTGAPIAAFALQQGEVVKAAIDRLVQQRGVLPVETPSGDLVIATPSTNRAAGSLTIGQNVVHGQAKHDAKDRFSTYVVKGQRQGHDGDNGAQALHVSATANDPLVTRYRPLMILAEDQATGASAASRASFAATVRAGRSQTGKLTVTGDRDASGALWTPNTLVTVAAADLGLQGDLLINEIRFKSSQEGTLTEVWVTRPEAYSLGEVKGGGLSRLDSRNAGRGAKARKGRKGRTSTNLALADLPTT
jgi:prophage tail gpP-like protein